MTTETRMPPPKMNRQKAERLFKQEDEILENFDSSKILEHPLLEAIAHRISGDWGGSINESREAIKVAFELGIAEEQERCITLIGHKLNIPVATRIALASQIRRGDKL